VSTCERLEGNLADAEAAAELAEAGEAGDLVEEALAKLAGVEQTLEDLEFRRMLSGEHDRASAIMFINAGAGGTESCDWAEMLLRMYRRWADARGFKNEVVDFTLGDGAGFRSVTMTIEGEYAYGYLKAENGVHRLVRISPFDANKRRHTSFTSVFVLPEIEDDVEVEIRDEDLRIDTYRSGGAGGQHVNKTDSAVRLTHLPTGFVVACQSERSQHQNKATAMRLLRAKLYELELQKREAAQAELEKGKKRIEWGSQIRSYVLQPYRLIKDHRTGYEVGNVDAVLDGDIDEFMRRFLLQGAA
jgi:peptide chain release factor 2